MGATAGDRFQTLGKNNEALNGDGARGRGGGGGGDYGAEVVGASLSVVWVNYDWFFAGVVRSFDARSGTHHVVYDDGDEEDIVLHAADVVWGGIGGPAAPASVPTPDAASMLRSPGVSMFERPVSKLFEDGGAGAVGGSSGGEQLPYRYFQARPPLHKP